MLIIKTNNAIVNEIIRLIELKERKKKMESVIKIIRKR
jgi:hypothetical protein